MLKQFACVALLFAVCATAHFGSDRRPWRPWSGGNGDNGLWVSRLCANQTVAEEFLSQTQQLINTLRSNGSFTRFLADRAQGIAYIENSENADLLATNCTAYFNGLKAAKDADRILAGTNRDFYGAAAKAMRQIIRNLFGGFGKPDSSENDD